MRWPRAAVILAVGSAGCPTSVVLDSVSVGPGRACGVGDDGLVCWGGFASWDDDDARAPDDVDFASVSLGTSHACGLDGDGRVHCFGPAAVDVIDVPNAVADVEFASVAAGHDFSCGVRVDDGSLVCWGINPAGSALDPPAGAFVDVSFGDSFYGLCARAADGVATCWGGAIDDTPPTRFRAIGAGASHACGVVDDDDSVVCWGARPDDPWVVPPAGRFAAVTAGFNHSCGLDDGGAVVCWGGGPAVDDVPSGAFVAVDAGSHQTCALDAAGAARCWGLDSETGDLAQAP